MTMEPDGGVVMCRRGRRWIRWRKNIIPFRRMFTV